MQNLHTFKTLSTSDYSKASALFVGSKAHDNQELFYNWVATSVELYFTHKDATHMNRAINGCKARGVAFVSVAKRIACHNWSVDSQSFIGKMNKSKMDSMLNINDDDTQEFEVILLAWLDKIASSVSGEGDTTEPTPLTAKQIDSRFKSLFTTMLKEHMTLEQIDTEFFKMRKVYESMNLKVA